MVETQPNGMSQMAYLPAYRIWNSFGFKIWEVAYSFHILCKMEFEKVPTPSLKTRPDLSTSFMVLTAFGGNFTVFEVSEKACPIRAAHFAGERMAEKSPSLAITALAWKSSPF